MALVLAFQKTFFWEKSGLIKLEEPKISGRGLNALWHAASILRIGALRQRASCWKPLEWAKSHFKSHCCANSFCETMDCSWIGRCLQWNPSHPNHPSEWDAIWETCHMRNLRGWRWISYTYIQVTSFRVLSLVNTNAVRDHWCCNECHHQPQW